MKKNKDEKIKTLIKEIDKIIERAKKLEKTYKNKLSKVHPRFQQGALNLIHYRALRMGDIRPLQKKLGYMGLSRLTTSQGHVMASLLTNKSVLKGLLDDKPIKMHRSELSIKKSSRLEKFNTKTLLGYRSKGRRTRVMVTLPSVAATNYQLVHDMIANGMNCARINCAHDNPKTWKQMIDQVRAASKKLKRRCKIAMDLGGPKIRTGALVPGPKIRKFRPKKDIRGKVVEPCKIWMGPEAPTVPGLIHLPVSLDQLQQRTEGDLLFFRDTRGKKRNFVITKKLETACIAHGFKTSFLETGMKLYADKKSNAAVITVGELPIIELPIILRTGDHLRLHKADIPGEGGKTAHLSCTLPEIIDQVKVGEPIFFDDGKIEGLIKEVHAEEIFIEIIHAKAGGGKLKSDKGINLPSSNLTISGLTNKDRKDLEFVVKHADVVNLSFVNRAQDVKELFAEMKRLKAREDLGVILKIETQSGFNNLTDILLEAMQVHPVGLMIARGDLAIESGWDNIGRIQEEILSLCHSAGLPAVWATQVLENLAKEGIPSRAEITDAAMAQRADCVMLNKGPFILRSIRLLHTILKEMASYQDRNELLFPQMEVAVVEK